MHLNVGLLSSKPHASYHSALKWASRSLGAPLPLCLWKRLWISPSLSPLSPLLWSPALPLMEGKRMKVNTGRASVFRAKHSIGGRWNSLCLSFFFFKPSSFRGVPGFSADFYLRRSITSEIRTHRAPANVVGDRLKWMGPPAFPPQEQFLPRPLG